MWKMVYRRLTPLIAALPQSGGMPGRKVRPLTEREIVRGLARCFPLAARNQPSEQSAQDRDQHFLLH